MFPPLDSTVQQGLVRAHRFDEERCACARCGEPVDGRPNDFRFCDDCNSEIDYDDE